MANITVKDLALVDSPQLIGTPTTVTPVEDDNSVQITNTLWVTKQINKVTNTSFNLSRILYVANQGTRSTLGQRGNINKPYRTIPEAITAATVGDTIFVFPGLYTADFVVDKTLTLVFSDGAKVQSEFMLLGAYLESFPHFITVYGGEFDTHVYMSRAAGNFSRATMYNPLFTGGGDVQYFSQEYAKTTTLDEFIIKRGVFLHTRITTGTGIGMARGPIRIQGRSEFGPCNMILDDCTISTYASPCITIVSLEDAQYLTLRGNTEFRPGVGQVLVETLPNGESSTSIPQTIDNCIIDERIIEKISENQYGNHPAFTSQARLNEYLLTNMGTGTPVETLRILDVQGSDDIIINSVTTA